MPTRLGAARASVHHVRRKVVHFNITDSPSASWTAQQIVNAFPYDTAPKYLLLHRDSIYGSIFAHDSPIPRPVESLDRGNIIEMPKVWGLHHQYVRQAA